MIYLWFVEKCNILPCSYCVGKNQTLYLLYTICNGSVFSLLRWTWFQPVLSFTTHDLCHLEGPKALFLYSLILYNEIAYQKILQHVETLSDLGMDYTLSQQESGGIRAKDDAKQPWLHCMYCVSPCSFPAFTISTFSLLISQMLSFISKLLRNFDFDIDAFDPIGCFF